MPPESGGSVVVQPVDVLIKDGVMSHGCYVDSWSEPLLFDGDFFSGSKFSVFWRGLVDSDMFFWRGEFGSEIQKITSGECWGEITYESISPADHSEGKAAKPHF